ncbi:hypothetical protein Daus18300_011960 [Diaporthe australafricana]|uniref:Uncharacterized protein n=1 Tax=Diaporthe australafricana TaxID=127596 RepID=A0ABR3W4R5_9PEZI
MPQDAQKRKSGRTDGPADEVQPRWSPRQLASAAAACNPAAPIETALPKKPAAKKTATVKNAVSKAKKPEAKQVDDAEDGTDGQQPAPAGARIVMSAGTNPTTR